MTDEEIDILVTEKVLGWTIRDEGSEYGLVVRDERGHIAWHEGEWSPTHHLLQAWQVLNKLPYPEYEWSIVRHGEREFTVMISKDWIHIADDTNENPCRAICLAVLQAKEIEDAGV